MSKKLPFSFYVQVLICACLWGSAFPVIKNSYEILNLDSYGKQLLFAGTRFTLAGLLILPFCRRNLLASIQKAPKAKLATIALSQTFFQYLFFYYALSVSSGTLGSLMVGAGSFWWVILAPILTKSAPPRPLHWVLLGLCSSWNSPGSLCTRSGKRKRSFWELACSSPPHFPVLSPRST